MHQIHSGPVTSVAAPTAHADFPCLIGTPFPRMIKDWHKKCSLCIQGELQS